MSFDTGGRNGHRSDGNSILNLRFESGDLFLGGLRSLDCCLLLLDCELKSLFSSVNLFPQSLNLSPQSPGLSLVY
jgi:hypothetical protein